MDEFIVAQFDDIPGRIGFRLGLIIGTFDALLALGAFDGSVVGLVLVGDFPLLLASFRFAPLESWTARGGAKVLLIPSLPRFMMLAGVTGVMWAGGADTDMGDVTAEAGVGEAEPDGTEGPCMDVGADGGNCAGGGIGGSSIGEGVSPGMSPGLGPPPKAPGRAVAGNRGVELADLVPRRLARLGAAGALEEVRTAGGWRLREGFVAAADSSSLEEADRRLFPTGGTSWLLRTLDAAPWAVLYAPSHGLVSGEISPNSSSAGEGGGRGGLVWKTRLAGAECGVGGIICWGRYSGKGWLDCCMLPIATLLECKIMGDTKSGLC